VPDEWSDRRDALPQRCVLRDYTIEEVLGHGGFGIVYKARHNELDHVVAIKEYLPSELAVREGTTVRPRSADAETHFADGLRRFREEARALIGFQQNPSIVDCREFFRTNGTAYLVMEYVEGLPLSEVLRQREAAGEPFTESDLLGVAIPLAEGLAHIHRAGVIHRDIKPANILVRQSDQRPVLIDFGAAKQAVAEHSRSLAPYTEGYAALEQVADGQLGPWTDLYGFGAVLWRMVAGGNRPWDPPNPVKVESRANARVREAEDPLPVATELGAGRFAQHLLEMIDGCLLLRDTERIRESDRVVQVLQGMGAESPQPSMAQRQAGRSHTLRLPDPVTEGARTGRSSNGRSWKIVRVAAAITVAVVVSTVALILRNGTVATPDRWSFSIEAQPSTATVALLNGPEPYQPGMLLPPGQYEIAVSAPGFINQRQRVTHSESETLHRVELETLPVAEPEPVRARSDSAAEALDSTAVGQERVPSHVSNAERSLLEAQQEPVETPTDDNLEAANSTPVETEQVRREESIARETVVTDSAVASDNERTDTDTKEVSPSNCGDRAAGWANCVELGESYYEGDGVARDPTRAAKYYEQACEGGYARGCNNLGFLYARGEGVGQDQGRAAELYQQACNNGWASGCYNLGVSYAGGFGVSLDHSRAAELYRQACNSGWVLGCYNLGAMYDDGEGVGQDRPHAAQYYERACEGGYARGCNNLGLLYSQGHGVRQDKSRAAELYKHACDGGGAVGCYNLGTMYSQGHGVRQDKSRAAELYKHACDGGSAAGCYNLGTMYSTGESVPLDHSRAAEYYQKACNGDDMDGCAQLAKNFYFGHGVGQDHSASRTLLQTACTNGHELACEILQSLDWR